MTLVTAVPSRTISAEQQQSLVNMVDYLAARWSDEKEYEDFNDYRQHMANNLPAGFKLVQLSSRPFQAIIDTPNGYTFRVKRNRILISYQ